MIWKKLFQKKNENRSTILIRVEKYGGYPVNVGLNHKGKFVCEFEPSKDFSDMQMKVEVQRIIKKEFASMENELKEGM